MFGSNPKFCGFESHTLYARLMESRYTCSTQTADCAGSNPAAGTERRNDRKEKEKMESYYYGYDTDYY